MATAVIIARFQTPYLHEGHRELIEQVMQQHNKTVVVLGISPVKGTRNNPYDYHTREKLIKTAYPDLLVLPLKDDPSDVIWFKNLDELLESTFNGENFNLYGSRDSFIPFYKGKFETVDLPEHGDYNATEIREKYADKVLESQDFRSGILYAVNNQYTKVYPTVDVAVFRNDRTEVLLGMKPNNKKWRFIGGYVDVTDTCYEDAAKRELTEEAGQLEVGKMTYEKSMLVDDWRYRSEQDKITTTLFSCDYIYGNPVAQDDIMQVGWFKINELEKMIDNSEMTPEHLELFSFIISKYK